MNKINTRYSEILVNDQWVKIEPINIKKGMIFRSFEQNGKPMLNINNVNLWEAEEDAVYNENEEISIKLKF